MSREQANTFKKYRDAEDAQGNLAWAARLQQKSLRQGPEASTRIDVEREFELREEEKIVWRLLKLPRKYMDLEHSGILPTDKMRSALRGLVAADVVDIVELADAKALLPAEIKRLKAEVAGREVQRSTQPLRARVFRPDISGGATNGDTEPLPPATPPSSAPSQAPAGSSSGNTGSHAPASSSSGNTGSHAPAPRTNPSSTTGNTGSHAPAPRTNPASTGNTGSHAPASRTPATPLQSPARSGAFSAPPTSALNDEDRRYRDDIDRAFAAHAKQNYYEFLGLQRPTDDGAVRAAYVRLAREYHPDRVAAGQLARDESLKSKVDTLFKRLGDAQQAVGTADARATYDRSLEALAGVPMGSDGKRQRRPLEAKNAFLMAETYFKKKDFKQAEAHYRQAQMFDSEDPKIATALAWCVFVNPDHGEAQRTAEARKRLTELANQHKYGDAAYKLGLLLRLASDEAGAQRQFAVAHRLDPEHTDAEREVRLADMRHKKAEQDKKDANSIFGKLGLKK